MADRLGFAAPARTRVLVVPLGNAKSHFSRYFELIRSADDIRLLDVSPIPQCRHFNPQAFPQGRVLYDFFTTLPEEETVFLHDFEPFRKTFVVLGVGSYQDVDPGAAERLAVQFSTAIVHNCIFFDAPADKEPEFPTHFYVGSELNITTMETIVCSITKNYLQALDAYASSFENITLRSPVSLTDSNVLTRTIHLAQKRLSSGSSFKVSFASSPAVATAPDLKMKSLQRQSGRQTKLMGNFFLLAGRCHDALQYFTDAAINLKKVEDYLWLASALEGLAVASLLLLFLGMPYQVLNPMLASVLLIPKSKLLSLATNQKRTSTDSLGMKQSGALSPRNSTSSSLSFSFASNALSGNLDLTGIPFSDFLRLLCHKASQFYQLSAADIENCVPDVVYVESLIRNIKFMICVYLAGGNGDAAILECVVKNKPIGKCGQRDAAWLLRSDIIREINKVFSLQLLDLDFSEQCRVYCALASIYGDLGLPRKRAFILRILLVALLPKVALIEKNGSIPGLASQASVRSIFEFLFLVYRIDTETESNEVLALNHYSGGITLQFLLLKICLRIAEGLRDYETLAKLCVLTLSRYTHCLPHEDQIKLREKLDWLLLVLIDTVAEFNVPHPDPFLVRNIKYVVSGSNLDLIPFLEHPSGQTNGSVVLGPVIFNPYAKSMAAAPRDRVVCVQDVQQLKVTFQNPFAFDVDIVDLAVVTDGVVKVETLKNLARKISSASLNGKLDPTKPNGWGNVRKPVANSVSQLPDLLSALSIPPNSLTQMLVSFKALNDGQLKIRGFDITIGNSRPQFFYIVDQEKTCGLQKVKDQKSGELSCSSLDKVISNLSGSNISDRAGTKELTLTVIPPQPSLSITHNLIRNGWLMLLEGERQKFSIELRNASQEPINFLSFSFWDSANEHTSAKLNLSTASTTYSAEDVYELEWQLLRNKPFIVLNKQDITSKYKVILPRGDVKIEYEINGKRGMTELKLILEYSNKRQDDLARSYIKNVSVPLNVSVHSSLEIIGCDVLPFFSSSLQGFTMNQQADGNELIQRNMNELLRFIAAAKESEEDDISSYCLLVLDVRNLWKEKLGAKFANEVLPGVEFVVDEVLDPTKTTRFLLPVKRISDDEVDVNRPIPSLRNKQFVKNYAIRAEEEQQMRRNFWIRSALLDNLDASWRTVGNSKERMGLIDLRCIRLSTSMANSLVYDNIQINHSVATVEGPAKIVDKEENEYRLQREHFYTLKTKIVNRSKEGVSGILRHVPFPVTESTKQDISIEQRILFNGVLQRHIGQDMIQPGESLEVELGFMILEKGRYEWGCVFDVFSQGKKVSGREPVYITAL